MTRQRALWSAAGMANVLSDEKKQQILALGRLGWSLRKIEEATGVRVPESYAVNEKMAPMERPTTIRRC